MNLRTYKSFLDCDKSNAIFRANYVLEQFRILKWPSQFLDIGCGSGELLRLAKRNGIESIYGVDGVQEALDSCRDLSAQVYQVDLNSDNLPFESEKFNGVACLEVLEHLYAPQNTLNEIYRVLEENTWAIISVPNQFSYSMRVKILLGENISDPKIVGGHIKFFRPQDLKEMCINSGFKKVQISGLAYPTAYKKSMRLANFFVGHWPQLFATWLFACCQK